VPIPTKNKVFVSYSRHDEALVRPLAGLLGVAAEDAVFLDVEQIKPGELWEKKIIGAVQDSTVFVICWCCQSDKSEFVAKEIATALMDENRRLVPVLFCSSSLPASLNGRQWIDLRGQVVHNCPIPHSHEEGVPRPLEAARPQPAPAMASPQPSMHPDRPAAVRPALVQTLASPSPLTSTPQMAPPGRRSRAIYVVLGLVLVLAALLPIGLIHRSAPVQTPTTTERPHVAPAPAENESPSSPKAVSLDKAASHGSWWIAILLITTPVILSIWILLRQRASRTARWREAKAASGISTFESLARPMDRADYLAGRRGLSSGTVDGNSYKAGIAARRQAGSPARQMLQRRRFSGYDRGVDDESDADVIARRAKSYFENLRS
jgi:hypothetical protein